METEVLIDPRAETLVADSQQSRGLVELVAATRDHELISTLRSIAEKITREAESAASALGERSRRVRSDAAHALAAVSEMVSQAEADARMTALAADEATDEALQQHLRQMADTDQARLHEGLEWIERAQSRMEAANEEARALEAEAIAVRQQALSQPEVAAWRQTIAPLLDRIKRARSRMTLDSVVQDAERQGFADSRLREAAALRERQLSELAWRTRETVKLWASYAAGGDGLYPRLTFPRTEMLAACGPGTIFEVTPDRLKVAVHLSEDGYEWVRHNASGAFKPHGALVCRVNGFIDADGPDQS